MRPDHTFSRARSNGIVVAAALTMIAVALGSPRLVRTASTLEADRITPSRADGATGTAQTLPGDAQALADPTGATAGQPAGTSTSARDGSRTGATAGPSAAGGAAAAAAQAWKGVKDATISIGVIYQSGYEALAALGAGGTGSGDTRAQARAVIDHLNANGGMAGRRIEPVYHEHSLTRAASGSDEATRACIAMTEDNVVFAAVFLGGINNECMAKRKTPILAPDLGTRLYPDYPEYLYSPSGFAGDRMVDVYVGGLYRQGFFNELPAGATATKVGVVTWEANRAEFEPLMAATLARYGLSIGAWGDAAPGGTRDQSIVLQFAGAKVTHVITPEYTPLFFMQAAETQRYHPRYGLYSALGPAFLAQQVPPSQLEGSRVVGTDPLADVDEAHDPGPLGPNQQLCTQIMAKAGLSTARPALTPAHGYCDTLFVLKRSLEGVAAPTPSGLAAGYEAIGRWDSPRTFRSFLAKGQHDGARGYRDAAYQSSCRCFVYQGPVHEL